MMNASFKILMSTSWATTCLLNTSMCQEVEMKVGKQPVALDTGEEVLPLTRPKEEDMVAQKPGKDIPMGKSSAISQAEMLLF